MAEVLLSAQKVTKRFGGLAAVNGVSVDLWRGKIHAVIGPNGAGKSTLTNLLSGDLSPTSGTVLLGGTNVTGWAPERTSRQGLGRSYQKTKSSSRSACTTTCAWRTSRAMRSSPGTPCAGGRTPARTLSKTEQPAHALKALSSCQASKTAARPSREP